MIKVYLDTNILIEGGARQEHDTLKKLSREEKIVLCKSAQNTLEQHGKVFPALHAKDKAMRELNGSFLTDSYKNKHVTAFAALKVYEDARKSEQEEKDYWLDSKMYSPISNFNTIVSFGGIDMSLDYKGEMQLCEKLLTENKLDGKDSLHVMCAYSAGSDYFLTWDRLLIKRCKNVSWLKMKVITPKEFLDTFKE